MRKHSPTPWAVTRKPGDSRLIIYSESTGNTGHDIARMTYSPTESEDAAFLVLAANIHEELITCLRQAIEDISLCNDEDPEDPISARIWQNVRRSEKVIAKAEGGK